MAHSVVLGVIRQRSWHFMHAFLTLVTEPRAQQAVNNTPPSRSPFPP
jgi:hypothetical protein